MTYHLHSGVDDETGRKIKTAGATLLITIGLPTLMALLNKIEPFFLPSVRGAQTSQTSGQGSANYSSADNKKDGAETRAVSDDAQSSVNGTSATGLSVFSSDVQRAFGSVGVANSDNAVPAVGGYGSGPVSVSPSAPQQPVTVSPNVDTVTNPVPDAGECLCPVLQSVTETTMETVTPVTQTVTDTTSDLKL